jgi:tetratricopeptide (TPR) repeat protein
LVVGNERYEAAVGPLRNSGNDAKAVARALNRLGFAVVEKHDLKRDTLLRVMDDFRKSLSGAEVALFYYAGHGISIGGANYLIPIKSGFDPAGADAASLRMLAETRLFNAEEALADMTAGGAKCNLAVLDACRVTRLPLNRNRAANDNHGTLVEMTPPTGSLIAFATDSGHTALDGDGKNGLYTEELLKNLVTPGITIEQVFKRTRSAVIRRSQGAQVPAEYSRLVGDDIYLAGEELPVMRATLAAPAEPVPGAASPLSSRQPAVGMPVPANSSTPPPNPLGRAQVLASVRKLSAAGTPNTAQCLSELKALASQEGPGDYALDPIDRLLSGIKEELKTSQGPSTKAIAAIESCKQILLALPQCVPGGSPRYPELAGKAHNRRGDALLRLGRFEEALSEFNAAQELQPKDPYVRYNRGSAFRALGKKAEARADFETALKLATDQPKARKLAREALATL